MGLRILRFFFEQAIDSLPDDLQEPFSSFFEGGDSGRARRGSPLDDRAQGMRLLHVVAYGRRRFRGRGAGWAGSCADRRGLRLEQLGHSGGGCT